MSIRPKLDAHGNPIPGHWIVDVRLHGAGGKRERIPFVGTERAAREFEIALRQGDQQPVAALVAPTFHDSMPEFLRDYSNAVSKNTLVDFHWAWKRLAPTFGCVPLRNLTPTMIEQYKSDRLAAGVGKRTINRELSYLSAIVRWAEERKLIQPLPFRIKRFPKKQTKSPTPTVHTPEEIAAVLAEVNPRVRTIALLLYDAGLRRQEATTLTGAQVDLKRRCLSITGKGSKERLVPILTERLRDALHQALRDTAKKEGLVGDQALGKGFLFINKRTGRPINDIRRALTAAAARAGVDKRIYHHLLRHDHGTHAALAEVDPRAVQRILGHSNLSTTELYTHLAGSFLAAQGAKFAALTTRSEPPSKIPQKKRAKS